MGPMWNCMPFVVSTDWIFPTVFHHINPIPYAQVQKRKFQCDFYEVPFVRYRPNGFPKKRFDIDDPDVKVRAGTLKVDFSTKLMKRGSFKTTHPGEIQFQWRTNPYTGKEVYVKQIYKTKAGMSSRSCPLSAIVLDGCQSSWISLISLLVVSVMVVSTSTWGLRVWSDQGKSWEPAHCYTITCDCWCLVIFHTFLVDSITSSCSTWFYCLTTAPS